MSALLRALDAVHAVHCAAARAGHLRAAAALRALWLRGITLAAALGGYGRTSHSSR